MKTEIDLSAIESALIKLGDATARQIADKTGLETKDVTRALNAMLKSATVEREKRGSEYVYWLTTTATTKPTAKPRAAAVAVHAALEGGTDPAPDLAEQLRQAHAERLAMSQTIIAICCAIGRDPGQTTTADLPQALRDYVDAQIVRITAPLTDAIAIIRAAIPAGEHLDAGDLAIATQKTMAAAKRDRDVLDVIRNTLAAVAADLVPDCGSITTEPEAIRIMAQLIDTQHAHLLAQSAQLDAQSADLESATRLHLACNGLTNDLMEPAGPFYDQAQGLRAAALLIDAQHTYLNDQALHIESQSNDLDNAARQMDYLTQQITELRDELEAQAAQHQAETGLLADKNAKLHAEIDHLRNQPTPLRLPAPEPTPDAYLVTRHLRAGRSKTVADSDVPTRHKSIETATRKARAAIRGGYVRAEIHATKLIAVATFGAEIKPV